jgi:hypothetical protein
MKFSTISIALATFSSLASLNLLAANPAQAQLLPEPWVSIGSRESTVTYSVGARWFDLGAEFGTGPQGATGVDVLKFFSLPFVSPYAGLGYYSGRESIAYSGGVKFSPPGNVFYGAGYHSIRGINGQVGVRF